MAAGGWVQLLNWTASETPNDVGAKNNFTTATDLTASKYLPPNSLSLGTALRFTGWGIYSTTGTPTLQLGLYYGGAASGTAIATTVATTTGSGVSNQIWMLESWFVVTALTPSSTTGLTMQGAGRVLGINATPATVTLMPATSAGGNSTANLNPTVQQIITIGAAWGTASTSNTITCYQFMIESLAS